MCYVSTGITFLSHCFGIKYYLYLQVHALQLKYLRSFHFYSLSSLLWFITSSRKSQIIKSFSDLVPTPSFNFLNLPLYYHLLRVLFCLFVHFYEIEGLIRKYKEKEKKLPYLGKKCIEVSFSLDIFISCFLQDIENKCFFLFVLS